ncbi:hypothetical protein PIB30_001667 [Stylosanthes scabra]|uniref:CCHC-type domain-containing protein n=1 Tax=Stylosanthes scabra TaxID=79078 RepID=A0ABU6T2X3_9FABA|nr:hypothetical protein [Stylosanthes scabra]
MDEVDLNRPKKCGLCKDVGHTRRTCPNAKEVQPQICRYEAKCDHLYRNLYVVGFYVHDEQEGHRPHPLVVPELIDLVLHSDSKVDQCYHRSPHTRMPFIKYRWVNHDNYHKLK